MPHRISINVRIPLNLNSYLQGVLDRINCCSEEPLRSEKETHFATLSLCEHCSEIIIPCQFVIWENQNRKLYI